MNKVVLAYSGGLDTSVAVAWLREQYAVDVVTLMLPPGLPWDTIEATLRAAAPAA